MFCDLIETSEIRDINHAEKRDSLRYNTVYADFATGSSMEFRGATFCQLRGRILARNSSNLSIFVL